MALNRRMFLRGAGTIAVGLPLLELTHGVARSGTIAAPKRFIVVFSHGGTISNVMRDAVREDGRGEWMGLDLWAPPTESETLVALGEEMAPLEPFRSDLLLLRGVDNQMGMTAQYGGGHRHNNVTALTCGDVVETGDDQEFLPLAPSIDQVLADRLQATQPVRFPSVDLEIYGHHYGTPHYRAAREWVSSEVDPRMAFDRLFAGVMPGGGGPDPELLRVRAQRRSVLDGVMDGFALFRQRLGVSDQRLVDAHLTHIRDLERQLEALPTAVSCTLPDLRGAPPSAYDTDRNPEQEGPILADIAVQALRCGLTNVVTLQIADIVMPWTSAYTGVWDLGHSLHHTADSVGAAGPEHFRFDAWRAEIVANRHWRMDVVGRLLAGLRETPEGDGNMLDNSLMVYTSEFSAGGDHSPRDVPMLLAGRAGGAFRTGRHINYNHLAATRGYETRVSTHNVFTSVLNAFGFDDEHFGNDTSTFRGPLSELT